MMRIIILIVIYAQVLEDFVGRIGKTNVGGKIEDLYFELNKWSFESKFRNHFRSFCPGNL